MGTTIDSFPDERLKSLFGRAHPAIDVAARTPLIMRMCSVFTRPGSPPLSWRHQRQ